MLYPCFLTRFSIAIECVSILHILFYLNRCLIYFYTALYSDELVFHSGASFEENFEVSQQLRA